MSLVAGVPTSYQYDTLWRIPGAVARSPHGQAVGLLPGAGAGEGLAICAFRIVPSATQGQPCLCVEISIVRKVGEVAEPASVGVEQLHRLATRCCTRYEDH